MLSFFLQSFASFKKFEKEKKRGLVKEKKGSFCVNIRVRKSECNFNV